MIGSHHMGGGGDGVTPLIGTCNGAGEILERGEEWGVDGAAPGVPGRRLLVRSLILRFL